MSKFARVIPVSENESRAVNKRLKVSPQKLGLVASMIRGRTARAAIADLTFSRKRIAVDVRKTLESAVANAENNYGLDVDDLVVVEAFVGKDVTLKRGTPRGRGKYSRILKRFSQLTVVVRQSRGRD